MAVVIMNALQLPSLPHIHTRKHDCKCISSRLNTNWSGLGGVINRMTCAVAFKNIPGTLYCIVYCIVYCILHGITSNGTYYHCYCNIVSITYHLSLITNHSSLITYHLVMNYNFVNNCQYYFGVMLLLIS